MVWRWRRYVDVGKLADEVFVCWDFQEKRFVKLSPFPPGSVDKDGNVIRGVLVDNGDGGRSVSDDVVARAKARLKQRRKRLITVIVVWFALLVICLQLGPSHFTLSHGTEPAILLVKLSCGKACQLEPVRSAVLPRVRDGRIPTRGRDGLAAIRPVLYHGIPGDTTSVVDRSVGYGPWHGDCDGASSDEDSLSVANIAWLLLPVHRFIACGAFHAGWCEGTCGTAQNGADEKTHGKGR